MLRRENVLYEKRTNRKDIMIPALSPSLFTSTHTLPRPPTHPSLNAPSEKTVNLRVLRQARV